MWRPATLMAEPSRHMTDATRARFPEGGLDWAGIEAKMGALSAKDYDFRNGRTSIFFFYSDAATYEIGKKAFMAHFSENALASGRAYPGLAAMERNILDYGLDLLRAPDGARGVFTTGGTESIFLGMKAARDFHRAKPGAARGQPLNMVIPLSAHPAFEKAGIVMDIEVRRTALGDNRRADAAALAAAVDENTMALVASAPCFPHGVIDPVREIGKIAHDRDIWLHVDACVGGWIAPWFRSAGRDIPDFDLSVPGVRSISADLHKFGFCPKPASTVFFRDAQDVERSTFRLDGWTSGVYTTATFCGTRPGAAVAGAWAVLNHLGRGGFTALAARMAEMTDRYVEGIRAIPGLSLIAEPDISVVNFGSDEVDIYAVAEGMRDRGWLPGLTRTPRGMQTMLAMQHEPVRDQYLRDLAASTAAAREGAAVGTMKAVY
jgi:glutamate/tyrosine decarboxylase-like PLP-dependent enzyme